MKLFKFLKTYWIEIMNMIIIILEIINFYINLELILKFQLKKNIIVTVNNR